MARRGSGLAVVTGASSAIGRAVAVALSEAGYDLAILGRAEDRLATTRRSCSAEARSTTCAFDLTDDVATCEAVARLRAERGEPRVLVHAAGVFDWVVADEADASAWARLIDLNLSRTIQLTRLLLPALLSHTGSALILIASAAGHLMSVDCRLAPAHPFPAALDHVVSAMLWASIERDRLAPRGAPLIVAGDSAGGCIAAAAAQRLKAEGGPTMDSQLLIYPMIEHHDRTPAPFLELARRFRPSFDDIRGAWDQYLTLPAGSATPFAVPARAADLRGLPPTMVLTAAQDPLRFETEAYAERMMAAGVGVWHRCYPEVGHSFLGNAPGAAGVDAAMSDIREWVAGLGPEGFAR